MRMYQVDAEDRILIDFLLRVRMKDEYLQPLIIHSSSLGLLIYVMNDYIK